jgi:hypothetical protein
VAVIAMLPAMVSGAADEGFTGTLSGGAEVPPVSTTAGGTVYVFIDAAQTGLKYVVTYTGLSGALVASHIHVGAPGVNGEIMFPLLVGPSTMLGSLTVADFKSTSGAPTFASALNAIRSGNAYINLHTALHPNGEVRAQLSPTAVSPTATPIPTAAPTPKPTVAPTAKPTAVPTPKPTAAPTATATPKPSAAPTAVPSDPAPPPSSTGPEFDRNVNAPGPGPLLLLLAIGISVGIAATIKVRPTPSGSEPKDD